MNPLNVILLVGEDTGRHHGCYGDPVGITPNIDLLAAEGCVYENAFSTAPVCAPSRSTLMMGKYAFSAGSHHMRSTMLRPPPLFTHEIRKAGGYVNWANKTDFNFEPPADYVDRTADWLEDLAAGRLPDRPWLFYHNIKVTHESTMWTELWEEKVAPVLPPEKRCDPASVRVPAYLPDTPEARTDIARYYDSLQVHDLQVGRMLEALDKSGQRENTVVIYMSDHGRGLLREKRWCYDAGVHLPLIIRWPGSVAAGTRSDELVSWVDLAPTILSIMGVPVPEDYQGNAFLGEGARSTPREFCFGGRDRMDEGFDRVRFVRGKRFHYIRNYFPQLPYCQRLRFMENMPTTRVARELNAKGKLNEAQRLWFAERKPEEELYDARNDPDNVRNLAGDPAHRETLERMRGELDRFTEEVNDLGALPERELIKKGLVKNRLDDEYAARIQPLPERYRIGVQKTVLEMPKQNKLPPPEKRFLISM